MPRKPRFNLIGIPQHIIQRGNNRDPCFFDESDYHCYLEHLKLASAKFDCRIHAYVLMTNHVHLLATPMRMHAVSEMMQSLGRRYVRTINNTYQRTGTLWEGRFKSSLIDSENYLLSCMRYIELNPVRASMVLHPGEYTWSSYHCNAQYRKSDLIERHPVYEKLGMTTEQCKAAYRELFRQYLDKQTLNDIRDALNHEVVLGQSRFKERIKQMTQRQLELGVPGRPKIEEDDAVYQLVY